MRCPSVLLLCCCGLSIRSNRFYLLHTHTHTHSHTHLVAGWAGGRGANAKDFLSSRTTFLRVQGRCSNKQLGDRRVGRKGTRISTALHPIPSHPILFHPVPSRLIPGTTQTPLTEGMDNQTPPLPILPAYCRNCEIDTPPTRTYSLHPLQTMPPCDATHTTHSEAVFELSTPIHTIAGDCEGEAGARGERTSRRGGARWAHRGAAAAAVPA